MPPSSVGPYEILAVIGRGGIGTVYRARHRRTGELAAVKLLGPGPAIDPTAARRLAREFETLQDLDHPNVVRVIDAGVADGYPYLAMELIEGLDLRTYLSPALDDGGAAPKKPVFASLMPSSESYSGPITPLKPFDIDAYTAEPPTNGTGGPRRRETDSGPLPIPASGERDPHDPSGSGSDERRRDPRGVDAIRQFARLIDEPETDLSLSAPMKTIDYEKEMTELGVKNELTPPPTNEILAGLNRPERIVRLREAITQVAEGLAYVHSRGLVHRDLKPTNIMIDDERRAKIMDFGLVKMIAEAKSLTATGRVVGTYRYMAPEQAAGDKVDARSDLYSVGVILYELLCGKPPFDARTPVDLWREVMEREPTPVGAINPQVDYRLAQVAHRLLRKNPDERYQSAEEVLEALSEG